MRPDFASALPTDFEKLLRGGLQSRLLNARDCRDYGSRELERNTTLHESRRSEAACAISNAKGQIVNIHCQTGGAV